MNALNRQREHIREPGLDLRPCDQGHAGGRADRRRAVPRDGFVEVSVGDTGVGIAPEDQEAVFEEFRQVGTADKKAEGTGLGLTCAASSSNSTADGSG